MPSAIRRPVLSLENFTTAQLAASRPAPLLQRDSDELEKLADDASFWVKAKVRGDVAPEAILELRDKRTRLKALVSYALVQLVRVSLKADYGAAGMRAGAFNEAKIYARGDYIKALIGAVKVARKCDWAPHSLPPAPVREPPPAPFEPFKRAPAVDDGAQSPVGPPGSALLTPSGGRSRRASSSSSPANSVVALSCIEEVAAEGDAAAPALSTPALSSASESSSLASPVPSPPPTSSLDSTALQTCAPVQSKAAARSAPVFADD